jgi:hypothetical protein
VLAQGLALHGGLDRLWQRSPFVCLWALVGLATVILFPRWVARRNRSQAERISRWRQE